MKAISIRELHEKTGAWIRRTAHYGEIEVTDHGRAVAKIVPHVHEPEVPYFARRKLSAAFRAIMDKLEGGTDSTVIVSEDRDRRME